MIADYSEGGYENGETDCVPYDDAYYYGPPPEAVFTDPTGMVYYGKISNFLPTFHFSVLNPNVGIYFLKS